LAAANEHVGQGDFNDLVSAGTDGLLRAKEKFDANRPGASFGGLCRICVRQEIRRFLARERKHDHAELLYDPPSTAGPVGRNAELSDLWTSLTECLSTEERQVVTMHYKSDMTYSQIADKIGVPRSTVNGRAMTARRRMRKHHARETDV